MSEGTETDLLEFYGTECGHCKKMKPLVERLELEANLKRAHTMRQTLIDSKNTTKGIVVAFPFSTIERPDCRSAEPMTMRH